MLPCSVTSSAIGRIADFPYGIRTVLVQKFQNNCQQSLNLGHTDTTTLKKGRDQYEKSKFIQVETLSA
ncbi:hypothetical protein EKA14_27675 [Bacillus mycoides]|nr:hypothetical protein EKA14_27675 [Bacillus mycoides]